MSDKIGKYDVTETNKGELLVQHDSINDKVVKAPDTTLIKVNGVWHIDLMPVNAVVEFEDGTLAKFSISPFRGLQEKDFTVYKGYHPRKCKGQPLPSYLYKFYGLTKNEESLSEVIHVRVTPSEKEKLEAYGQNKDLKESPSEVVRNLIKEL